MIRAAALLAAIAMTAAPAAADDAPGSYGGFIHMRVGSASSPFFTAGLTEASSEFTQAISFVLGGHFRLTDDLTIGLRLPAAPSVIEQPGGSYVDDKAFGNPELFVEHRRPRIRWGAFGVALSVRGAIGAPLAGHGSEDTLTKNRVVEVSNAIEGWRNQELYTPGVVPLTVSAQAVARSDPWQVVASVELPLMIRVSDASLPAEAETRALAITPHLLLGAAWWPRAWLGVSARAFAVVQARAPVATAGGSVQLGIEPRIEFAIGDHVAVTTDLLVPIGGPLDGTLGIGLGVVANR